MSAPPATTPLLVSADGLAESDDFPPTAPTDPTMAQAGVPRSHRAEALPSTDAPGASAESLGVSPVSSLHRLRMPAMPGYDLLGELGRGGMGIVYRAKQTRLNRLVAMKMLLHHDLADPSDVARFRSEAEAVASVKHPHVVQVYEFGHVEGRPYFAMEFLAGGSLHARLKATAPFPPESAAALLEKLARAVHAAHAQGIIHRDLKPGNVLFDTAGEPRVTDFGLAKRVTSELTQTQAVMGTPAYMAPEQASGRTKYAGPAADLYALGVILYECLTGDTPFRDEDSLRLLSRVIQDAPPSIRSRVASVPKDLERICLKCLEKEPADRYPTAAALADDLRRFLDGEAVSVRPAGCVERFVKWTRRRPMTALAYGLGLLAVLLTVFGGGMLYLWFRADAARARADHHADGIELAREELAERNGEVEEANAKLEGQNRELAAARDDLKKKHDDVGEANTKLAETNKQVAAARDELRDKNKQVETALNGEKSALEKEKAARATVERLSYFRNVGFAYKELKDGNYLRAIQLLDACEPAARRWEWWHVYRAAHTEFGSGVCAGGLPYDVAFLGDTHNVVTAQPTHSVVTRFDFKAGRGRQAKFHPDKWLAAMRLSADGNRMLTIRMWDMAKPYGVEVWDFAAGVRLAAWKSPRKGCRLEMLSGDGRRVVVGYEGEPIRAYDVDTGKPLGILNGVTLTGFTFGRMSHDGATAAVIDGKQVVVWRVATGEVLHRLPAAADATPTYVAVSPDGNRVVIGDDTGGVHFHDSTGEKCVTGNTTHGGPVTAIAFSRDGTDVATAGEDGVVRMWKVGTAACFNVCAGHTRKVFGLRFSRDGRRVASTDALGGFRVWDVREYFGPRNEASVDPDMRAPYFLRDDLTRLFANTRAKAGRMIRYDNRSGVPFEVPTGGVVAAFRPGDDQMILGGSAGELFAFAKQPGPGRLLGTLRGRVESIAYTPDGRFFLALAGGEATAWDAATFKPVYRVGGLPPGSLAALSPDGKAVAIAHDKYVQLHDLATRKATHFCNYSEVSAVGFTPAGDRLVVGTRDWRLEEWEATPDQQGFARVRAAFIGHTAAVTGFAYNPDGTRLATGAADGTVKVWDVSTRTEALGLSTGHRRPVSRVWWGPNDALAAIPDGHKPVLFYGEKKPLTIRPDRLLEK